MHRIDTDSAIDNKFVSGSPQTGQGATQLNPAWCNSVQEEIALTIEAAGIALNAGVDNQLLLAIKALIADLGVPVGTVFAFTGTTAPAGYVFAGTTGLLRATYSRLWTFVQASGNLAADATDYTNNPGKYGRGNGATTFDMPKIEDFISGTKAGRTIGTFELDQMQRIQADLGSMNADSYGGGYTPTAPFSVSGSAIDLHYGNDTGNSSAKKLSMDTGSAASQSAGLRAGTYTRPRNTAYPFIIKY